MEYITPVEIIFLLRQEILDSRSYFLLVLTDLINRNILKMLKTPDGNISIEKDFNSIDFEPKIYEMRFLSMYDKNKISKYYFIDYMELVLIDILDNQDWLTEISNSFEGRNQISIRNRLNKDLERKKLIKTTTYFNIYKMSYLEDNLSTHESGFNRSFYIYSYLDQLLEFKLLDFMLEKCNDYLSLKNRERGKWDWGNYNSTSAGF